LSFSLTVQTHGCFPGDIVGEAQARALLVASAVVNHSRSMLLTGNRKSVGRVVRRRANNDDAGVAAIRGKGLALGFEEQARAVGRIAATRLRGLTTTQTRLFFQRTERYSTRHQRAQTLTAEQQPIIN
jgi:hypothetical protein